MGLLQMSLSGAVMIIAIIVIRALAINHLPKKTFLILWGIVLLRLMVPFSIPSALSVYSLAERNEAWISLGQILSGPVMFTENGGNGENVATPQKNSDGLVSETRNLNGEDSDLRAVSVSGGEEDGDSRVVSGSENPENDTDISSSRPLFLAIWCAGMLICATCFAASYLRSWLKFQESIPVEDAFVQKWVEEHACRRLVSVMPAHNARMQKWLKPHPCRLSVRQSDRVSTPLTYGIFHPVILMPKNTDWENRQQLQYVLMHEYVHICRLDALTKLLVTCALCIHWFNPMVWMMWVLFSRDVELSCDESVLRHMGEASKADRKSVV